MRHHNAAVDRGGRNPGLEERGRGEGRAPRRSGSQGRGHLSGKMTWTDNLNTRGEEVDDGQSDNHVEN